MSNVNLHKWFWYIIAVKTIYFCIFFPCLFDFDAALGMRTFLDPESAICNHHPVFVEAIHALFFTIGAWIGFKTFGFALLSILFIFASSWVIIYGIQVFCKAGVSNHVTNCTAAVYTFIPFFPYLSLLPTKDGFFAYAFLLYFFTLIHIYITGADCLRNKWIFLTHSFAAMLVCFTRQQGLIIVSICAIALLITYRENWAIILKTALVYLSIPFFTTSFFYPRWNVEPGGKQELFGTLFQQTACYLCHYPNDITDQEYKAVFKILDEAAVRNRYEFHITDPVKNEYKYNPRFSDFNGAPRKFRHIDRSNEREDLSGYLCAWASMGKRHPWAYINATATISLGFFYNVDNLLLDVFTEGANHPKATSQEYQFWRVDKFSRLFSNFQSLIKNIPFISWIVAIPYYIWICFILLASIISRKDSKAFAINIPILLSIAVLLLCPVVNGRYIFPIVICLPALLIFVLATNQKNTAILPKQND